MPQAMYPSLTHMPSLENGLDLTVGSPSMKLVPTVLDAIEDLSRIPVFTGNDRGISAAELEYKNYRKKYSINPEDAFSLCHSRKTTDLVYGHLGSVHTPESMSKFTATEPGKAEPTSRFFKLAPDGLCNTLRAGTNSDKGAFTAPRPIHYSLPRCISVREAARLHTFPDWFQFHRTIWHGFREIGNAVIPLLARELGMTIVDALGVDSTLLHKRELKEVPDSLLSFNVTRASEFWGVSCDVIPKRKRMV
jgi:DNA (cytosine-5)-methyltransferase 1